MATYEVERERSFKMHPALFDDGSERGEALLLRHLFFVNGGGYEWASNGELVNVFDDYTDAYIEETIALMKAFVDRMWEQEYRHGELYAQLGMPVRTYDEFVAIVTARDASGKTVEQYAIYPLWDRSVCMLMPDNITPSWLSAARRALEVGRMMIRTPSDDEYLARFEQRLLQLEAAQKEKSDEA